MSRLCMLTLMVTAFILTFGCSAQAQFRDLDNDAGKSWNLHAGVGFLRGDTKDDTTIVAGVERLKPLGSDSDGQRFLTFGVDWVPIDTLAGDTSNTLYAIAGYRQFGFVGSKRIFFGLGVGARWASDAIPEANIDKDFEFAWSAGAGIDITSALFVDLRFLAGGHPSDDGVFSAGLGYRF